jgi:HEAT repeat protein
LSLVDDRASEQPLLLALEDPDPWVRYFAAGSLGRRRIAAASELLADCALHDPATHVRIAAMHALGVLEAPHLTGIAARLMRDADPDLAAAALSALSSSRAAGVDDLLEDAVRSADASTRIPAVQALAGRPAARSAEVLGWAALVAEPRELRHAAVEGLRRLARSSSPDAVDAAVTALLALSAERSTRDEALPAVVTLPEAAVPVIGRVLTTGTPPLRAAAVDALARMRHPQASEALVHALQDPAPAIRSAAVAAFGRLGTARAAELVAAMQDDDPDEGVRRRAAAVCRRYGWRRATPRT